MKVLLMHLSDMHIRDESFTKDEFINPIVSTLNELPSFNRVIIVISGDIAFSGKAHEYTHAKHFIGKLVKQIKQHLFEENHIDIIMVPGNHDIDFADKPRARIDICKAKTKGELNSLIQDDINTRMCSFYDLAKLNKCFVHNKLVEKVILDCQGYKMEFNIINSAPCSAFNDPNGDDEHALHYFNPSDIASLSKAEDVSVSFTVIHHGLDWYDYNSKKLLEDKIANESAILFVGHDHIQHTEYKNIDGNQTCLIMRGGTISSSEEKSEFNYVIFDTDRSSFETFCCESSDGKIYSVSKKQSVIISRSYSRNGLHLDKDFLSDLNFDNYNKTPFQDIFVFPTLSYNPESTSKAEHIETVDSFKALIADTKICIIEGGDLSGKTQLLKYLYLSYFDKKFPLLIDANEIKNHENITSIIRSAFSQQYSREKRDYSLYEQLQPEDKVLLLDNLHRIKDANALLAQLKEKYALIICTTEKERNKEDIKALVLNNLEDQLDIKRLKLEAFYYTKRSELLGKVYKLMYPEVSERTLAEKVKEINTFINDNLKLFNISPYFICSYCRNYAQKAESGKKQIAAVGEVFHVNLVKSFEELSEVRVETAFFILNKVGFFIMANRRYPLHVNEFNHIIEQYNSDYEQSINASVFLGDLVKAKILRYSGTADIEFCSLNILAFFAGKCISDQRNTEEGRNLIHWLIKNVCFGINSEVLKFITAFNNDVELLNMLIDEIEQYYSDLVCLDFDSGNLRYLFRPADAIHVSKPNKQTKKKVEKTIEETERNRVGNVEIINIFDYTDEDLEKYVNKANRLGLLCSLSASLYAQFYHIIPAAQKKKYLHAIFTYPCKTAYSILKPFDEHYNQIVDDLYQEAKSINPSATKKMVEDLLSNLSEILVFSIFITTARNCASKETLPSIQKLVNKESPIKDKLLLMMVYEQMGRLILFGNQAIELNDKSKYTVVRNLVKYSVFDFYVWHDYEAHGYAESLAAKFFENEPETMKRIRNKTIKKK